MNRRQSDYFVDGQYVRHSLAQGRKIWAARYNAVTNKWYVDIKRYGDDVVVENSWCVFPSLSAFALAHVQCYNPARKTVYAWAECQARVGDTWVTATDLPRITDEPVAQEGGCRVARKCFVDGQRVRHVVYSHTWIGVYDASENKFVVRARKFGSLNRFALAHLREFNPKRKAVSAWLDCEVEINGKWVSTFCLPDLTAKACTYS